MAWCWLMFGKYVLPSMTRTKSLALLSRSLSRWHYSAALNWQLKWAGNDNGLLLSALRKRRKGETYDFLTVSFSLSLSLSLHSNRQSFNKYKIFRFPFFLTAFNLYFIFFSICLHSLLLPLLFWIFSSLFLSSRFLSFHLSFTFTSFSFLLPFFFPSPSRLNFYLYLPLSPLFSHPLLISSFSPFLFILYFCTLFITFFFYSHLHGASFSPSSPSFSLSLHVPLLFTHHSFSSLLSFFQPLFLISRRKYKKWILLQIIYYQTLQ